MAARVVVVGSCNIDLVARCAALPRRGETVLATSLATIVGGKGANQAIAAARAGARCAMIGAVGEDAYAEAIREAVRGCGIDITGLRAVPGPSGMAIVVVDDGGENSIIVISGANRELATLAEADLAIVEHADALLLQLEIPLETSLAAATRSRGLRVLTAAPAIPLPADLLAAVDLLIVNETEALTLVPARTAADALPALLELVPRVALTLGPAGVRYGDRDGAMLTISAPVVTAVDTTAAGDTFAGVLATALAERRTIPEALQLACAAASLCVEAPGASASIPLRSAIDARRATTYGVRTPR